MGLSKAPVVKVLDTTTSETGETQKMDFGFLNEDKPLRVSVKLSTNDVVVFEARSLETNDWEIIKTFTSDGAADIYPSQFWQMRRSNDGTVGESQAWVENRSLQQLNEVA